MSELLIKPIGKVLVNETSMSIKLDTKYIVALKGLEGYSHLNVLWWFDGYDNEQWRNKLEASPPYKNAPVGIGTFATRSPKRPNPIALSVSQIINIDYENGIINLVNIDAYDNSPVLDLKPYSPSSDRVKNPLVPEWCNHWPKSIEESADFDWISERIFRKWDMTRK